MDLIWNISRKFHGKMSDNYPSSSSSSSFENCDESHKKKVK
jgi:hypothetical protein